MKEFLDDIAFEIAKQPSAYKDQGLLINMHALPTTLKLLDELFVSGFRPENTLFIGKPYSTIASVQKEICRRGVMFRSVAPQFKAGNLVELNMQVVRQSLHSFLLTRSGAEYVLLDSGGHLTMSFDEYAPEVPRASVQLTSSGSRLFARGSRRIVDLGTHEQKRNGESIGIAGVIVEQVLAAVPDLLERKIAVIGIGAIGEALAWQLRRQKINIAHYKGTEKTTEHGDYDVVIGATGYDQSALAAKLVSKNRSVDLFSASSWDIEFGKILAATNAQIDFSVEAESAVRVGKDAVIHNAGCPVNFNRVAELERERDIAVTRGLTLTAALDPYNLKRNMPTVMQLFKVHYGP